MTIAKMTYSDTALPQNSDVDTLWNSASGPRADGAEEFQFTIYCSHATTVKGYWSPDLGTTWYQFYEYDCLPLANGRVNEGLVYIGKYKCVKFTTTSGGNQTTYKTQYCVREAEAANPLSGVMAKAFDRVGPDEGDISVVAITTSSAATKFFGASAAQFGVAYKGCYVTLISNVDVYILFGDSGVAADETATTGDTRCFLLPAKTPQDYRLPLDGGADVYVALKGTAAGFLRAHISSVK